LALPLPKTGRPARRIRKPGARNLNPVEKALSLPEARQRKPEAE